MLIRHIRPVIPPLFLRVRAYTVSRIPGEDKSVNAAQPRSSCPPNTVLEGLAYLKGQPPILALPDEEYPEWLWDVLAPKVIPDDGPGGKAEKMRLRKENKQRIKDQNFMKTQ